MVFKWTTPFQPCGATKAGESKGNCAMPQKQCFLRTKRESTTFLPEQTKTFLVFLNVDCEVKKRKHHTLHPILCPHGTPRPMSPIGKGRGAKFVHRSIRM